MLFPNGRLCGLPPELLVEIASALEARDVESLGVTCALLHGVARDDTLWKRLFIRDHAHRYTVGVPAAPWPYGDRTNDPWPDFALRFCGITHEVVPRGDTQGWIPMPFARMRAMGKDARWLYVAHVARRIGTATRATPASPSDDMECDPKAEAIDAPGYVGDTAVAPDGTVQPHGYATWLNHGRDGHIVGWSECLWDMGQEVGWSARVTSRCGIVLGTPRADGTRPKFISFRSTGSRTWCIVCGADNGKRVGPWIQAYEEGLIEERHYEDGRSSRSRVTDTDGSVTEYRLDERDNIHGEAMTHYANGDRVAHSWRNDSLDAIVGFTCSERCAFPEFAGRFIAAERWAWREVDVGPSSREYIFWPIGDSESVGLFTRYVADGLIGWCERTRAIALGLFCGALL